MAHELARSEPEQHGIYTVERAESGVIERVYFYQVNFLDGRTKLVTQEQKERLVPMIGNPDMKFIEIGDEIFATHQVGSITKEKEPVMYSVGGVRTSDHLSALTISSKTGEDIGYYLPKGEIYLP